PPPGARQRRGARARGLPPRRLPARLHHLLPQRARRQRAVARQQRRPAVRLGERHVHHPQPGRAGLRGARVSAPAYDLVTMGRSSIDLYANDVGAPFVDIESFAAYVGGSPTNIAVGAQRLGLSTALLTA